MVYTANVTPLFKKGSKHHVNNYRPVSLTSICKVVESVVRDELVQHLDKHNLIYGTQHMDSVKAILVRRTFWYF